MLQLKPIDQIHYKVFGDNVYLIKMRVDGKAELYVFDSVDNIETDTIKMYTYLHTYSSLDNLLHCLYERRV